MGYGHRSGLVGPKWLWGTGAQPCCDIIGQGLLVPVGLKQGPGLWTEWQSPRGSCAGMFRPIGALIGGECSESPAWRFQVETTIAERREWAASYIPSGMQRRMQ